MHWEKFNNYEERLLDEYGNTQAYLVLDTNNDWHCKFHDANHDISFHLWLSNMRSVDEAKIRSTEWIKDVCNDMAKYYCRIRDRLPDTIQMYREMKLAENINENYR